MLQKIRYRLVWNYGGHLNKDGRAQVALECRQGGNKIYIASNVLLSDGQWDRGMVVNHDNSEKLTAYLVHWKNSIEEIELDSLLKGKHLTLFQLKMAIKTGVKSNATLTEFSESIIKTSDRRESTKQNYYSLCNDIEKYYGKITLDDITHDWIEKFRIKMRSCSLAENTIKAKLKSLRCIINEALKRNLITDDPFKFITIGIMSSRVGYLELSEVERLEALPLKGKDAHIRDAFVFCCYTGLRFSDFIRLKNENIEDNILSITQQKTSGNLTIPLQYLFGGKPLVILSRYKSINSFAKIGCNTTANRALKDFAKKAGINKRVFWHIARHTCATLLNKAGVKMQVIQKVLGHSKMETTSNIYAETSTTQVDNALKDAFKDIS